MVVCTLAGHATLPILRRRGDEAKAFTFGESFQPMPEPDCPTTPVVVIVP